jgi:hypothetical protein
MAAVSQVSVDVRDFPTSVTEPLLRREEGPLTAVSTPVSAAASALISADQDEARYTSQDLAVDQLGAHPVREAEDPGSPLGDPSKFVERQIALSDDRIDTISRTICETIIASGSRQKIRDTSPSKEPKSKKKPTDKDASMLAGLARDAKTVGAVTARELQLTCGQPQSKDQYFGRAIDRTHTVLGHTFLIDRLTQPTTDWAVLEKRRSAIGSFHQTHSLRDSVSQNLQTMQQCEGPFLSFWNKVQPPNCVGKLCYQNLPQWMNDYFNRSSFWREAGAQYDTFTSWLRLGTQTVGGAALMAYSAMLTKFYSQNDMVTQLAERYSGTGSVVAPYIFYSPRAVQIGAAGAIGAYILSTTYGSFRWLLADRQVANIYYQKMKNVANFMDSAKNIYDAVQRTPALAQQLEHFSSLEQFFNDPELQPLFSALQKLGPHGSCLSRLMWHPMLISMQYLQDKSVRSKIEKALVALAEIDTVLSCAQLIESSAATPYSLANFTDGPSTLRATGLFNPQVPSATPVLNSVELTPQKKVILTGPNGGGKTTLIRATLSAAMMAQTLTVVPAQEFSLTPFDDIRSALNTQDDAAGGLSHFQAQVQRATGIVHAADDHREKRYLIAMDEPFNGADAKNAAAFCTGLLSRLGQQPNCLCLMATHDQLSAASLPDWTFTQMEYGHQTHQPLYRMIPGIYVDSGRVLHVAASAGCDSQILASASTNLSFASSRT